MDIPKNLWATSVYDLGELSTRTVTCLKNENLVKLEDLVNISEAEMLRIPNFGRKSLLELQLAIRDLAKKHPEGPPAFRLRRRTGLYMSKKDVGEILRKSLGDSVPKNASKVEVLWNADIVEIFWIDDFQMEEINADR